MMTRVLAAILAGSVLAVAAPAFAADLNEPIPAAPYAEPEVATAFDWTGAYVGAAVGYGFNTLDVDNGRNGDADGFNGALYAGYNYAVTPNVIVGAEADVGLAQGDDFRSRSMDFDVDPIVTGSLRGRLGYAFGNFMAYGTGGVALAHVSADVDGESESNTHVGWTAGGGVEAALTTNITARAEYLYTDTGSESYSNGTDSADMDLSGHNIRVGLGYKF